MAGMAVGSQLQQLLAEVLALAHPAPGPGRVLQALLHAFLVAKGPGPDPPGQPLARPGELALVVAEDEALHGGPLEDQVEIVLRPGRHVAELVTRDAAADD